jgi:hypothetical protein
MTKTKKNWSECVCKDCGYTWNAIDDEHFNCTCCPDCYSLNIGGHYHKISSKKDENSRSK